MRGVHQLHVAIGYSPMSYPPEGDPNNRPPQYPTGQPPQSQPGQPPQNQPGQPPQYQPGQPPQYQPQQGPMGYSPYPADSAAVGYGGYTPHIERPGSVTAGAVISIVLSGISALAALATLIGLIAAWDSIIDEFRSDPGQYELTSKQIDQIADAQPGVIVFVAIWAAIAVFGVFVGIVTLKGQNWGRITLTVLASLSLVIGLLLITSVISAIWVIGSIAAIICLYVGGANDWFRYQSEQRRQQM